MTAKNTKAFVLVYHFEGQERRDTVGRWPEWSVAAAWERAKGWKRGLTLGIDPRGKPPAPATDTLKARAEQYLADPRAKRTKRPLRPSTVRTYRRALRQYAAPLHDRPLQEIRRREVAELLDKINQTRGPSTAMLTRTALGRLYTWAMARDYAEHSPVAATEGWQGGKRGRTMTDDELRLIWLGPGCSDAEPGRSDYNFAVQLLLRLGLRPQEASGLSTDEVNGDVLELPGDRTKSGAPLLLPLPHQVRRDLDAWLRTEGRKLYFGKTGAKGFGNGTWADGKRALDQRIAQINAERRLGRPLSKGEKPQKSDFLPAWQHRDLRRTVETRLAKLGVRQEIINRLLNHAIGSITTVYNQYEYFDEKREASQKWSDELDRIVGEPAPRSDQPDHSADELAPDKVVPDDGPALSSSAGARLGTSTPNVGRSDRLPRFTSSRTHGWTRAMARPPGSSPYDDADRELVVAMEILVVTGVARDMFAAARMLQDRAPGSPHGDARRKRLRDKYRRYVREHGPEALRAEALATLKDPERRAAGGPAAAADRPQGCRGQHAAHPRLYARASEEHRSPPASGERGGRTGSLCTRDRAAAPRD